MVRTVPIDGSGFCTFFLDDGLTRAFLTCGVVLFFFLVLMIFSNGIPLIVIDPKTRV